MAMAHNVMAASPGTPWAVHWEGPCPPLSWGTALPAVFTTVKALVSPEMMGHMGLSLCHA